VADLQVLLKKDLANEGCNPPSHWRRHSISDQSKPLPPPACEPKRVGEALDTRCFSRCQASIFGRMKEEARVSKMGVYSRLRSPPIVGAHGTASIA
jgi:hypothetical protein